MGKFIVVLVLLMSCSQAEEKQFDYDQVYLTSGKASLPNVYLSKYTINGISECYLRRTTNQGTSSISCKFFDEAKKVECKSNPRCEK